MSDILLTSRFYERPRNLHFSSKVQQPLNLLYIASLLEKDRISVRVIDPGIEAPDEKSLATCIRKNPPKVALVATDTINFYQNPYPYIEQTRRVVDTLKKECPDCPIVLFGPYATLYWQQVLDIPGVDLVLRGDAPKEARQILIDLLKNPQWRDAPASFKQGDGSFHDGGQHTISDLNSLPPASYGLLHMEDPRYAYTVEAFRGKRFCIVASSRGCFFKCAYCFKNTITNKVRFMSVERLKEEIETLKQHRVEALYFIDELFTFKRERTLEICHMFQEHFPDIIWGCQTRPNLVDFELMENMARGGCRYISFGVESGSQKMLDLTNSRITLERIEQAVDEGRRAGIDIHCNTMLGFPNETYEDLKKTTDLLRRLGMSKLEFPSPIMLHPSTEMHRQHIPQSSLEEAMEYSGKLGLSSLTSMDVKRAHYRHRFLYYMSNKQHLLRLPYYLLGWAFPSFCQALADRYHKIFSI
jgi:radical SAM superfamily enzyme YgiQ (UPF0313 family)